MTTNLGKQLDAEAVSDARHLLDVRLNDSLDYARYLSEAIQRAYSAACNSEPVTALVLLPLIEQARRIEQRLAELMEVRR